MLNLKNNFAVQKLRPWLPACSADIHDMLSELPKSLEDIRGVFTYYGTREDETEWLPDDNGPEKYVYQKYFTAYIAEEASRQRGEPVFYELDFLCDTLAKFKPYATLETVHKAIWFFCHDMHETSSRLDFFNKARELSIFPSQYELREFLSPPHISDYRGDDRTIYLEERRLLSEHIDWETPEYTVDGVGEMHIPHYDTSVSIVGSAMINGLECRISGLSSNGVDISGYVMGINLTYDEVSSSTLIEDIEVRETKYGSMLKTVGVQTAPLGWLELSVVFKYNKTPPLSSQDLSSIREGRIFDISAVVSWNDTHFVSISGRGIWKGKSHSYLAKENEFILWMPANTETLKTLGIHNTKNMWEEADDQAGIRLESLR